MLGGGGDHILGEVSPQKLVKSSGKPVLSAAGHWFKEVLMSCRPYINPRVRAPMAIVPAHAIFDPKSFVQENIVSRVLNINVSKSSQVCKCFTEQIQ